ncbi:EAL domain-containing protein [Nocardioides sp. CER19]|uniref:putative bifunctional diguanylate cyclase/phosphodiesterase n=1 Tax=Nocardioides sp. CER19 TaxID=3038538 RepID=UPI00244D1C67|nr:EAL domain-containing protein [Nocardioides sp. CER19]MDH2416396.1 EAL domain-containing protein [Nocardioides sp. CER19]
MTPIPALVPEHSTSLVAIAAVLCLAGAWAASRFFQRMTDVGDRQRYAWLFLTSLASGVSIWGTHFVAMLGYHPGVPMSVEWLATALSLLIAVLGSAVGFLIGGAADVSRARVALGGTVVGLAVSSMHYVGMSGLRMQGTMSWNEPLIVLSVVFAVGFASAALLYGRSDLRHAQTLMWLLFTTSVLALHFTGMAAMSVAHDMSDMAGTRRSLDPETQYVLAVAIAGMAFVTLGSGMVGYLIDNNSRASAVERLRRLAMYDVLTGLPNRASLNERLAAEIERSREHHQRLGLVVIDIDNFKEVNDLHGHPVGDEVLRVLGSRMAELIRGDDEFVARIGGDEFIALCRLEDDAHLPTFLDALRQVLSGVIHVRGARIAPRASIGAATFPDHASDAETLVNNADLAMYRAKSDPLHDICLYDASVDEQTRQRRGLTADLREALARGELFLHYQVQTAVATGETRGYEALLRWRHPELGLVSPAEFIPLAEESGLIAPIGEWVLRTACAEAARWVPPHRVSVNVSAVQLAEAGLARTVREVLEESGLPAHRLELEMTETAVFTDRESALQTLLEIKDLGVGIALDDFGVGYSSLDALRTFPFDRIKIDRSFFSGGGTPEQTVELVQAVLSLGRTFGMSVLAEGIETDDQLALLTDTGCDEAQGYLFGRPASLDDIVSSGQLGMAAV